MPVAARLAAYYFAFFAHAGAFVTYFALYLAGLGLGPGLARDRMIVLQTGTRDVEGAAERGGSWRWRPETPAAVRRSAHPRRWRSTEQ